MDGGMSAAKYSPIVFWQREMSMHRFQGDHLPLYHYILTAHCDDDDVTFKSVCIYAMSHISITSTTCLLRVFTSLVAVAGRREQDKPRTSFLADTRVFSFHSLCPGCCKPEECFFSFYLFSLSWQLPLGRHNVKLLEEVIGRQDAKTLFQDTVFMGDCNHPDSCCVIKGEKVAISNNIKGTLWTREQRCQPEAQCS